jgi:hypothetical protein
MAASLYLSSGQCKSKILSLGNEPAGLESGDDGADQSTLYRQLISPPCCETEATYLDAIRLDGNEAVGH